MCNNYKSVKHFLKGKMWKNVRWS